LGGNSCHFSDNLSFWQRTIWFFLIPNERGEPAKFAPSSFVVLKFLVLKFIVPYSEEVIVHERTASPTTN
jgi:hypothetical protein